MNCSPMQVVASLLVVSSHILPDVLSDGVMLIVAAANHENSMCGVCMCACMGACILRVVSQAGYLGIANCLVLLLSVFEVKVIVFKSFRINLLPA